jgi:coatomer subunit delta
LTYRFPFFAHSAGSYPTVSSHVGEWSLNPSTHSLEWAIPRISAENRSGSLEFTVGGDDASAFFPVKIAFVGQGSLAGIDVASAHKVDGSEEAVVFSTDCVLMTEDYRVV